VKLDNLSKDIVQIMVELSKNDGLARLLTHNVENPFAQNLPVIDKTKLIKQDSELCKIRPYPFDVDAVVEDNSFIRVYFNNGDFNENEVIAETQLHVDIIVAKSLWLINDGTKPLIRPYEIMSRVLDMIGKRAINSNIRYKFDGWQHLYVNTKFDAIRLYSETFSVEA